MDQRDANCKVAVYTYNTSRFLQLISPDVDISEWGVEFHAVGDGTETFTPDLVVC